MNGGRGEGGGGGWGGGAGGGGGLQVIASGAADSVEVVRPNWER